MPPTFKKNIYVHIFTIDFGMQLHREQRAKEAERKARGEGLTSQN